MPHDLSPWQIVYHYPRLWRLGGVCEELHAILCELVRLREGQESTPSAAIIHSQSVKTTEAGRAATTGATRPAGESAISS